MTTTQTSRPSVEERRAQAEAALERELRRIVDSGEYARWFATMARFHRYSPTNTLWILAQRPHATRVASYRTWQQIGRHVRRGESGIMVFHPKPYWVDPTTGERVPPPTTPGDRVRLERHVTFGVGYVFDVSQTEGEPLPQLGTPPPDRAPRQLGEYLAAYCHDHGVTVAVDPLRPGLDGYYDRDTDRIVVAAAASDGARLATLAHELAHREDPELIAAHAGGDRRFYAHNRADCEAVAEAVAHTLSARFGHDLTPHSAGYIASWIDGDVERFRQLHDRVGQVTQRLVPPDRLDAVLAAARSRATTDVVDRNRRRVAR